MNALNQSVKFTCFLSGSDLPKQEEQLGAGVVHHFPWNFSQNGLVAYKNGVLLEVQTISKFLGENNIKRIVNWVLKYLSELDIPIKVCNLLNTALHNAKQGLTLCSFLVRLARNFH